MTRHARASSKKMQLFPLNVFDQGQNGALHIISGHDDGLRPGSAQFFQGPQPPFSGDELVFSRAHPPNQQRRKQPVFPDGFRQRVDGRLRKGAPGLGRIGGKVAEADLGQGAYRRF